MLREQMIKTSLGKTTHFRWRGHEISRIEGLSDAVFGFAVTLLVVSLCSIALLSLAVVLLGGPNYAGLAGLVYMLTGVAMGTNGTIMGRRRRRMARQFAAVER